MKLERPKQPWYPNSGRADKTTRTEAELEHKHAQRRAPSHPHPTHHLPLCTHRNVSWCWTDEFRDLDNELRADDDEMCNSLIFLLSSLLLSFSLRNTHQTHNHRFNQVRAAGRFWALFWIGRQGKRSAKIITAPPFFYSFLRERRRSLGIETGSKIVSSHWSDPPCEVFRHCESFRTNLTTGKGKFEACWLKNVTAFSFSLSLCCLAFRRYDQESGRDATVFFHPTISILTKGI